jgi:two-component system response regulator HydG
VVEKADPIRLLLVGAPHRSEFRTAAGMARDAGAEVTLADTPAGALAHLRVSHAGLVMIDVELNIVELMAQLKAERFAVPVLACGINASADRAVAAIRAGAHDYLPLPPDLELIAAALTAVVPAPAVEMVGEDPALRHAVAFARSLANSRAPVLICGEAGTGKEMMARAIHAYSGRPGRFLAVECAGVAAEVVEAELFGHEAGAFAGAVARRLGRLEEANGGTLFVADVDCLAPVAQGKLLSALDDAGSRRVVGGATASTDVRLIASTRRDLQAMVGEGSFRADLFARLNIVRTGLPPLRERAADIPLLARHLAARLAATHGLVPRPFADETLTLLGEHEWPGNVQELENVTHRALLLATGSTIGPEAIVLNDGARIVARSQHEAPAEGACRMEVEALVGRTVEEVERELILQTLERCQGNRTSASMILGISVRTMRNKLRSFIEAGIPVAPAL